MGYYTEFHTKEIRFRTDTPSDVITFIEECINPPHMPTSIPNHLFFKLKRWDNLFLGNYWLNKKPYFKKVGKHYRLSIHCEINYAKEEFQEFGKWITPYVIGHKPVEYIGSYSGENENDKGNIYIYR